MSASILAMVSFFVLISTIALSIYAQTMCYYVRDGFMQLLIFLASSHLLLQFRPDVHKASLKNRHELWHA